VGRELGRRRVVAVAHNGLGAVAYFRNDLDAAVASWTAAAEELRALGDHRALGLVVGNLGSARLAAGDVAGALAAQTEALAVARGMRDRSGTARALLNLGEVHLEGDRLDDADGVLAEALDLARETGERHVEASVLHHLGRVAARRGDHAGAGRLLVAGLEGSVATGQAGSVAGGLEHLAVVAAQAGLAEPAAELFASAAALRRRDGSSAVGAEAVAIDRWSEAAAGALGEERAGAARRAAHEGSEDVLAVARHLAERLATSGAPAARTSAPDPLRAVGLTEREAEIARLLARRWTDREIAAALHVSVRTVTTHVSAVLRKLAVPSRRAVAAALGELGVEPGPAAP
jgi:DNA-binding CsgD family transcriptional regulator